MFSLWLQRQPEASWRQLMNALANVKLESLASEIESLLTPFEQQENSRQTTNLQGTSWTTFYHFSILVSEEIVSAMQENLSRGTHFPRKFCPTRQDNYLPQVKLSAYGFKLIPPSRGLISGLHDIQIAKSPLNSRFNILRNTTFKIFQPL